MNKAKSYVKALYDGNGDVNTYYMKGRVKREDFMEALERYCGKANMPVEAKNELKLGVWRFVPDNSGEFSYRKYDAKPGSPGSFLVTYLEVSP